MKYKIPICTTFLFVFLFCSNIIFAKKVMILQGLVEPDYLIINSGKVYVSDAKIIKVFIYSIKESRLLKDILKKGTGPQECPYYPRLQSYEKCLCIYSSPGKVMFFSTDGVYQNEFRVLINGLESFFPVGKNYVARKNTYSIANSSRSFEFSIYSYENKKAEFKKLLYSYSIPTEKPENNKQIVNLIRHYTNFLVYDNKVFLGDSKLGLYLLIFDSSGNQIGRIKIPDEKMKITDQYKNDYIEIAKKYDPAGFELAQKISTFRFPEYFPGFFRFAVDKGKIYFLTYKIKGDQREVVVADFKGNVLKKAYVPMTKMGIDEAFAIDNDKYYYILENEDTEEYELHVADIK